MQDQEQHPVQATQDSQSSATAAPNMPHSGYMERFYQAIIEIANRGLTHHQESEKAHYDCLRSILSLSLFSLINNSPEDKKKFVEAFGDTFLAFFTFIEKEHHPDEVSSIELYSDEFDYLLKAAEAWKNMSYEKY